MLPPEEELLSDKELREASDEQIRNLINAPAVTGSLFAGADSARATAAAR